MGPESFGTRGESDPRRGRSLDTATVTTFQVTPLQTSITLIIVASDETNAMRLYRMPKVLFNDT